MRRLRRLDESGQAQLLTAAVMSVVILSAGLYSLNRAQNVNDFTVETVRRTEMRTALDDAIKRIANLYQQSAGCDPVLLDEILNRVQPDGTLSARTVTTRRQLLVAVNQRTYRVALGPVMPIRAIVPFRPGTSMDTAVEVWTSARTGMRQLADGTQTLGGQRMIQRATLINTCTRPCSAEYDDCRRADPDPATFAYHRIIDPAAFPGAGQPFVGCDGRAYGDIDTVSCGGARGINVTDLLVLGNYLRTGEVLGTCERILTRNATSPPNTAPPVPWQPGSCQDRSRVNCDTTSTGCADLNRDDLVNEVDMNILEKTLRGYLNLLPVRRF